MKKGCSKNTFATYFILTLFLSVITTSYIKAQCINVFPHVEDFETSATWAAFTAPTSSVAATSDWAWGTPNHTYVINSAGSGNKCWCVGTLTGSFYNYNQESYVLSPCYDFTNLQYPHIKFKLFYDSEYKYDGGNLQSSIDGGATWVDVGTVGGTATNPIPEATDCNTQNWYNYPDVTYLNSPAGFVTSKNGWCGNVEAGGTGWDATHPAVSCVGGNGIGHWVTAEHCLTGLAGQPNVLLRFTFGAGYSCNDFDGFAFDSVAVSNGIINTTTITTTCGTTNTINFNSGVAACPTNTWTWNFGDPASGTGNTSTAQNPSHTFSGAGTYTVTLIASGGICNPPDTVTKIINIISASITASNVTCNGLNNGTATVTVNSGIVPISYTWSPSGGNAATAANLTPTNYTVYVADATSCPVTATINITQPQPLSVTATATPVSCSGAGSATATATGGTTSYTYTWVPSGGNSAISGNLSAGNYTVLVSDSYSCTSTASVVVVNAGGNLIATVSSTSVSCKGGNDGSATALASSGTTPYSYTWSPSGGNAANAVNLSAGNYTVTISDANNCTAIASTSIAEPASILLSASPDNVLCNGMSTGSATVTATNGIAPYAYSWYPAGGANSTASNLPAGNYTVFVTDHNLCKDSISMVINQPPALTAIATSTATTCNYNNGTVSATANGGTPNYNYAWMPNGGNSSGATALASGNYTVTVTDANNCMATAQTNVAPSNPVPAINFSENPGFGCAPVCALFSAVAAPVSNDTISSWVWNFGDGSNFGSGNNPNHCYTITGSYNVQLIATDQNGCKDTLIKKNIINVYPKPIANFYASPWETDIFNPAINFYDQSQSNITNWNWNLGNGATSNLQNPEYTYQNEGTYPVTLIVTNASGCKDTITKDVKIDPIFTFYAPNCTTPNGDGNNEMFLPVGTGWDSNNYDLWVFDRWGNMFFHTKNPNQGWNGTRHDDLVQEDTYVWKVDLIDVFGKEHQYHGTISVVR